MRLRRLRDGDVLENGDVVLVRGGDLAPDILIAGRRALEPAHVSVWVSQRN